MLQMKAAGLAWKHWLNLYRPHLSFSEGVQRRGLALSSTVQLG